MSHGCTRRFGVEGNVVFAAQSVLLRCLPRLPWPLRVITSLVLCRRLLMMFERWPNVLTLMKANLLVIWTLSRMMSWPVCLLSSILSLLKRHELKSQLTRLNKAKSIEGGLQLSLSCRFRRLAQICRSLRRRCLKWAPMCQSLFLRQRQLSPVMRSLFASAGLLRAGCTCVSHVPTACEHRLLDRACS